MFSRTGDKDVTEVPHNYFEGNQGVWGTFCAFLRRCNRGDPNRPCRYGFPKTRVREPRLMSKDAFACHGVLQTNGLSNTHRPCFSSGMGMPIFTSLELLSTMSAPQTRLSTQPCRRGDDCHEDEKSLDVNSKGKDTGCHETRIRCLPYRDVQNLIKLLNLIKAIGFTTVSPPTDSPFALKQNLVKLPATVTVCTSDLPIYFSLIPIFYNKKNR